MTDLYFLYPLIIGGILRTPDSATSLKLIRGGRGNIKVFMFLKENRGLRTLLKVISLSSSELCFENLHKLK